MRKLIPFILIFCILTGCVKQSDYDALMQENAELTAQVAELTQQKDELIQLQKANEPERTIKARIVGGFSGVVNGVVGNWMNGHSDEMGYRYYVTVTPYQADPVLIRVASAEPMDIAVGTMYFFGLKMNDTLGVINEPLEIAQETQKPHAPFPPSEYWFDTVKTPLGGEDSGVNGIQFFWEEVND